MKNVPNGNTLQSFAEQFVASTRRYLFVRLDGVLILRSNKVHHVDWQQRIIGCADSIRLHRALASAKNPLRLTEHVARNTQNG